jgi:hypothetical protein
MKAIYLAAARLYGRYASLGIARPPRPAADILIWLVDLKEAIRKASKGVNAKKDGLADFRKGLSDLTPNLSGLLQILDKAIAECEKELPLGIWKEEFGGITSTRDSLTPWQRHYSLFYGRAGDLWRSDMTPLPPMDDNPYAGLIALKCWCKENLPTENTGEPAKAYDPLEGIPDDWRKALELYAAEATAAKRDHRRVLVEDFCRRHGYHEQTFQSYRARLRSRKHRHTKPL